MATTLTSKSQLTLPKPIREYLKVGPGDRVEFCIGADGAVRVEPVAAPAKPSRRTLAKYRKLRGSGGHAGGSTDELMRLLRGCEDDANDPGFAAVPRP